MKSDYDYICNISPWGVLKCAFTQQKILCSINLFYRALWWLLKMTKNDQVQGQTPHYMYLIIFSFSHQYGRSAATRNQCHLARAKESLPAAAGLHPGAFPLIGPYRVGCRSPHTSTEKTRFFSVLLLVIFKLFFAFYCSKNACSYISVVYII